MTEEEKLKREQEILRKYSAYGSLIDRIGRRRSPEFRESTVTGINDLAHQLFQDGGLAQQQRMIRDKRRTLDRVVLYSYQGAFIKKYYPENMELMEGVREAPPVRALINPNKLKQDYDDKVLSVGYEFDFHPGDVFEWCNTGTYWLIYLQDLTELAYFRGDIRKCSYQIAWLDDEGNEQKTFAAIRGPVETKINYIQKHGISVDIPNYSLSILMPLNEKTKAYFQRYSRFYLQGDEVCWRVEAVDWISTPGILEVIAVEYYANETEDDIENGLVGALKTEKLDPNPSTSKTIVGDTFIKVKQSATYLYNGRMKGTWYILDKVPVELTADLSDQGKPQAHIKWISSYPGQFTLYYGDGKVPELDFKKTIVVESLF